LGKLGKKISKRVRKKKKGRTSNVKRTCGEAQGKKTQRKAGGKKNVFFGSPGPFKRKAKNH